MKETLLLKVLPHPEHEEIFVTPNGEVYRRLVASLDSGGYHTIKIRTKTVRRHRLVLETYVGPSNGLHGRHLDGDPSNDSHSNLAWGTPSENGQDAVRHGTTTKGIRNPAAKVTEADVLAIRRRIEDGEAYKSIAKDYGVTIASICDMRAKRTWGWL